MMRILDATRDELFELFEGKYVYVTNNELAATDEVSAGGIVVDVTEIADRGPTEYEIVFDWGFAITMTPESIIMIDHNLSNC